MFTQLIALRRFGSALRILVLALLLSGAVAPAALGNHQRSQVVQSTSDCGSATEDSSGVTSQELPLVADPAGGSDTDDPDDTVPVHPFTGRPW